jgi:BirA family biotin operon repressor/biotin-[acetyl-CoA-carboxylase] ligase
MNSPLDAENPAPQLWNTRALWEALTPWLPDLAIEVKSELASTNSSLLERARRSVGGSTGDVRASSELAVVRRSVESQAFGRRHNDPGRGRRESDAQPCLLVAETQTAGRGRNGKAWQASRGCSLTFSLLLPYAPPSWGGLSLAVGMALAEALDPRSDAPPRIGLKWPNDLFLLDPAAPDAPGRKLGGILIESVVGSGQRRVVVGVGLNVRPLPLALAREAKTPVASLSEIWPQATPPEVLARVAPPLVQALLQFEREGWAALAPLWPRRDVLCGRWVSTSLSLGSTGAVLEGQAIGVGPDGSLKLQTPQGEVQVSSGEVSVKCVQPAAPGSTGEA